MLPPSDSLNHQNLKLAEFIASLQKKTSLPAPPPPYAANALDPKSNDTAAATVLNDVDEYGDDDGAYLAPIVIKIDTSICIDGQGNTIAIPSSIGSPSSPDETNTPIPVEPSSPAPTDPATAVQQLQQLQQRRQAKSTQLASAIISALKSAGVLEDPETSRQRPIEINVNAGIRIKGHANVICSGTQKRSTQTKGAANAPLDRKRRAQSEPICTPVLKKQCPSKDLIEEKH
ncbi:hypothetical protein FQN57_000295 [Myotisia sp. PD_48]|nr:hypothetical protein FQN57_000295 [Myotisia sp. PD_48]